VQPEKETAGDRPTADASAPAVAPGGSATEPEVAEEQAEAGAADASTPRTMKRSPRKKSKKIVDGPADDDNDDAAAEAKAAAVTSPAREVNEPAQEAADAVPVVSGTVPGEVAASHSASPEADVIAAAAPGTADKLPRKNGKKNGPAPTTGDADAASADNAAGTLTEQSATSVPECPRTPTASAAPEAGDTAANHPTSAETAAPTVEAHPVTPTTAPASLAADFTSPLVEFHDTYPSNEDAIPIHESMELTDLTTPVAGRTHSESMEEGLRSPLVEFHSTYPDHRERIELPELDESTDEDEVDAEGPDGDDENDAAERSFDQSDSVLSPANTSFLSTTSSNKVRDINPLSRPSPGRGSFRIKLDPSLIDEEAVSAESGGTANAEATVDAVQEAEGAQ
jgi:hypothetical protein